MKTSTKVLLALIAIVAVFALVIGSVALVGGNQPAGQTLGASGTRFPNGVSANSTSPVAGQLLGTTLTVGSSGSSVAGLQFSSCAPSFSSADLAASTTAVGICTDATAVAGDKILVTQRFSGASTGLPTLGLFPAITVIASTTGAFGVQVTNFTGAATTSINTIYRTYSYLILR